MVVIAAAACGSSSKSQTASTATAPATTATATTATSSGNSPSRAQAAVCTQAIADLQPLQAAASTNNASQIEAEAGRAASKLTGLQSRPGITPETRAALGQLTGALQAFAHGARGQAVSTQLSTAGQKLAVACK